MKRKGLSPEIAAAIAARNEQVAQEKPSWATTHCQCDHDGTPCGGSWHLNIFKRNGQLLTVCSACVFGDDVYVGTGYINRLTFSLGI